MQEEYEHRVEEREALFAQLERTWAAVEQLVGSVSAHAGAEPEEWRPITDGGLDPANEVTVITEKLKRLLQQADTDREAKCKSRVEVAQKHQRNTIRLLQSDLDDTQEQLKLSEQECAKVNDELKQLRPHYDHKNQEAATYREAYRKVSQEKQAAEQGKKAAEAALERKSLTLSRITKQQESAVEELAQSITELEDENKSIKKQLQVLGAELAMFKEHKYPLAVDEASEAVEARELAEEQLEDARLDVEELSRQLRESNRKAKADLAQADDAWQAVLDKTEAESKAHQAARDEEWQTVRDLRCEAALNEKKLRDEISALVLQHRVEISAMNGNLRYAQHAFEGALAAEKEAQQAAYHDYLLTVEGERKTSREVKDLLHQTYEKLGRTEDELRKTKEALQDALDELKRAREEHDAVAVRDAKAQSDQIALNEIQLKALQDALQAEQHTAGMWRTNFHGLNDKIAQVTNEFATRRFHVAPGVGSIQGRHAAEPALAAQLQIDNGAPQTQLAAEQATVAQLQIENRDLHTQVTDINSNLQMVTNMLLQFIAQLWSYLALPPPGNVHDDSLQSYLEERRTEAFDRLQSYHRYQASFEQAVTRIMPMLGFDEPIDVESVGVSRLLVLSERAISRAQSRSVAMVEKLKTELRDAMRTRSRESNALLE